MVTAESVTFVRLDYPYGKSQVYLPTDLLLQASRVEALGIEANVVDLNVSSLPRENNPENVYGIGVFGAPYIPRAIELAEEIQERGQRVVLGGQAVEKLSPAQTERLFGKNVRIGDRGLVDVLGVEGELPTAYETPIASALAKVPDQILAEYLSREFSVFLSQGCVYRCDFCAADKERIEVYREQGVLEEDLIALTDNARRFGIDKLDIYLSSLDLFQNPEKLAEAMETFVQVSERSGVNFNLRALARANSFVRALSKEEELGDLLKKAKLETVGFGVDGTSERIWRKQHKGRQHLSEVDLALDLARDLEVQPEILMIMGFPEDDARTLTKNYLYTVVRALKDGVTSRPYLAKPFVPGNKGWDDPENARFVEKVLENPELFRNLDFAALGSVLTHPNIRHRVLSNAAYAALVLTLEGKGRNATYPLLPQSGKEGLLGKLKNTVVDKVNARIPFDK